MSEHHHAIRVLTVPGRVDTFLSRTGDKVDMDIPGGRVTFVLNGGWSESGIAYCHLRYEPIRSGLIQFGEGPKREVRTPAEPWVQLYEGRKFDLPVTRHL